VIFFFLNTDTISYHVILVLNDSEVFLDDHRRAGGSV